MHEFVCSGLEWQRRLRQPLQIAAMPPFQHFAVSYGDRPHSTVTQGLVATLNTIMRARVHNRVCEHVTAAMHTGLMPANWGLDICGAVLIIYGGVVTDIATSVMGALSTYRHMLWIYTRVHTNKPTTTTHIEETYTNATVNSNA